MTSPFRLELGMPHLGRSNLSEVSLFKELGHHRWRNIETLASSPSGKWRDSQGAPVYATFYYVEISCPPTRPLSHYGENCVLTFETDLSHFGKTQLDGCFRLDCDPSTWLRACNVFVVQEDGPSRLRIAPPANLDYSRITALSTQPDARRVCKIARDRRAFFEAEPGDVPIFPGRRVFTYELDPDRDLNGAGLVYFANFIAFLDLAERKLLAGSDGIPMELLDARSTYRRKIGYYANARASDHVDIEIEARMRVIDGSDGDQWLDLGFDYCVTRRSDNRLAVVSSARKSGRLAPGSAMQATVAELIASRRVPV